MKSALLVTLLFTVASGASPAEASGAMGRWTCEMDGTPAGLLTISAKSYSYEGVGTEPSLGTYAEGAPLYGPDLAYAPGPARPADSHFFNITSGPLHAIGVSLGFYDGAATHPTVSLAIGPGKGMTCTRA